ncbi:MAG: hypothetical protein Q9187_000197 [Circinaria calcarea]
MGISAAVLFTYVLGGLTFFPTLIGLILLYSYLTLPHRPSDISSATSSPGTIRDANDDDKSLKSGTAALTEQFHRGHEPDVAEGYFVVCREYVPGGQNGKPPERTTPAGEVVAEESPSVYQSMYRSIFDRRQAPTLDPGKANGKTTRKAANVFYITLRHSHLILFDDREQLEVRHVISLNHHDVSIYGGGNEIPEGELWIKRNAICLTRKPNVGDVTSTSKPFYLFSDNCSEKEDFYFALLQNQERRPDDSNLPPTPQQYEVKDIISLVQRLHSSEEQLQTRWINALIGRLFLAMYKTQEIEDFVRLKITKKIARVKKPAFLSGIILQKIDLGEAAPYITNPRLKDLTVDSNCCVEADFKYNGNFRLEIAATARIDLGTRFKAREVNLVLAVVIKKLEGHVLVRLKPPPSNRLWISFEKMPSLEMSIEPIISTRQITYGIIIRAIESRIREVVAETIVLPHWDDSPFTDTLHQRFRGGIWANGGQAVTVPVPATSIPDEEAEDEFHTDVRPHISSPISTSSQDDRSMSMPALVDSLSSHRSLKDTSNKSTQSLVESTAGLASSSTQKGPEPPKAIRSRSFASAADPVVSMDNANIGASKKENTIKYQKDAASSMLAISSRSQPASPIDTPVGSPTSTRSTLAEVSKPGSFSSVSSKEDSNAVHAVPQTPTTNASQLSIPPSPTSVTSKPTISTLGDGANHATALHATPSDKRQSFPALGATAAAAKKWGWSVLTRNNEQKNINSLKSTLDRVGTPEHPIGRGHPLPPIGQPLPPPDRHRSTPITIPKRKPLPSPSLPPRRADRTKAQTIPPPLPSRRREDSSTVGNASNEGVMIVQAPPESEPTSPLGDIEEEFVYQMKVGPDEGDNASSIGHETHNMLVGDEPGSPIDPSIGPKLTVYGTHEDVPPSWQIAREEARPKSISSDELELS